MIIRKIKPEELKRTSELFSIAFEYGMDSQKSAAEVYEETVSHPKSREDVYWMERWAAFEDDDRTMMSYFSAKPFPVQFDGNVYTMTGIGGVSSLPQYRRSGGIRGCFEAALPAMYKDSVAFSYLYPFSTAYYRKFGYEMGCSVLQYHVRLDSFKRFAADGFCSLAEPGNLMYEEICQIYRAWQKKYNMMIANESYEFDWALKSNPVKDQEFTYVYRSKGNVPLGYMTVKQVTESDGRNLQCNRFCCINAEGLKGLLNLLLSLGTDHAYATFELPADMDLSLILPEWSMGAASMKKLFAGMVRVVNVEKVLYGARYQGSGSLSIEILDKQIPENCGVFTVSFEHQKASSVVKDSAATPDLSMGINEFSRLIIGEGSIASMEFMDNITVHGNLSEIEKVFYSKPSLIREYF